MVFPRRRVVLEFPLELLGSVPGRVSRRFPVVSSVCDVERLESFGEVGVYRAHAHVKEAQGGIIDDITRDNKVVWVLYFACDEIRNGVVFDPDLGDK